MNDRLKIIAPAFFLLTLCLCFLYPNLLLLILGINLTLMLVINFGRIHALTHKKFKPKSKKLFGNPMVSIHVPSYNEPPELMINTLRALSELNYDNYEVIVLDNNTPDPAVWQPVKAYCDTLGDKFRFFHFDGVKGFKAGALNISYDLTDENTEYILVIDADYVLEPTILETALSHFTDEKVGLVQFPQAYLNTEVENAAMKNEYAHFFSVYMNVANHCNCVLSTGTVSFIRKSALEAAGLWHGDSITEDVDLGLNIYEADYCGVFVNENLGRGLMPSDLDSVAVQRERWVYGNMQTLMRFLRSGNFKTLEIFKSNILFLTAWFNFLLLPVLGLAAATLFHLLSPNTAWLTAGKFAAGSIVAEVILTLAFFMFMPVPESLKLKFSAFLQHISLAYEGSVNWLKVPFFPGMGFKRTNKFLGLGTNFKVSGNMRFMLLLVPAMLILFAGSPLWQTVIFGITILLLAADYLLRKQLNHTAEISKQYYETTTLNTPVTAA